MSITGAKSVKATRRIRLGMVGGGQGAFIGAVHRLAARMDDKYEFVAGALSADAAKAKASGDELGLAPDRIYSDFKAMARAEAARADGIEAVAIVTPNHVHVPAAIAFIEAGIHVICDKPLALSLKQARQLAAVLKKHPRIVFALTHNYSGYPMIRQIREMVQRGVLGEVRLVQGEYPQDWLTQPIEKAGQKQAAWRTDPKRSGVGGSIGDIGTHVYQLGCFASGLEASELAADLHSFVSGRVLDDNAHIMLRYKGGAKGMIWVSQVAPGNENGLKLRVYGTKGGVEWMQADPNYLWYTPYGEPKRLITRGGAGSGKAAARVTRVPPGHPEGYLEGFATLYTEAAAAILAARSNRKVAKEVQFPGIDDGLAGMAFIEACVKSSKANGRWVKLDSR